MIRGLAEAGMTMIIVTYEVGFARDVADRIVFMDDSLSTRHWPAASASAWPAASGVPVHGRRR